jgi:hypothetical protein
MADTLNIFPVLLCRLKYFLMAAGLFLLMPVNFANAFNINDQTDPNVPMIRRQLLNAINSGKVTDSLYSSLGAMKNRTSLINGYMAALEALKAKHTWNPYFKVKYLSDAEKSFKNAVANDPHNIEIRFMRFSVEHNVPGFLGYNKNLDADRVEMIRQLDKKNYALADDSLVKTIITFLIDSKRCSPAEQHNLNQHLAALK